MVECCCCPIPRFWVCLGGGRGERGVVGGDVYCGRETRGETRGERARERRIGDQNTTQLTDNRTAGWRGGLSITKYLCVPCAEVRYKGMSVCLFSGTLCSPRYNPTLVPYHDMYPHPVPHSPTLYGTITFHCPLSIGKALIGV